MAELKLQPRKFNFTSYGQVVAETFKIFTEDYTFSDFCDLREWIIDNEQAIKVMLDKGFTLPELRKKVFVTHSSSRNKGELIDKAYRDLFDDFDIAGEKKKVSYTHGGQYTVFTEYVGSGTTGFTIGSKETPEERRNKFLDKLRAVTPAEYEQRKGIEREIEAAETKKNAALEKILANPETLSDFGTFIDNKGEDALTPDQRATYDALVAIQEKSQRQTDLERKAVARKVELGDVSMYVTKTIHTKEKCDLWVVRLSSKVEREVFLELKQRAHSMEGWYSNWDKGGAIPGFLFRTPDAAEKFMKVKDGDVDTKELLWQRQEKAGERRSLVLQSKGQALIEEGEAALQVKRKDNTLRRAGFAAAAEQNAVGLIETGKILIAIGKGMEEGTVTHLEFMNNITEMDQLRLILARAESKYRRANDIRPDKEVPRTPELAEYAEFPYPVLYRENVLGLLKKLAGVKGKQMAANRIGKALCNERKAPKGKLIITPDEMEDFEKVFISNLKGLDKWEHKHYKEQVLDFNRVYKQLKLQSPAAFRAALRELIVIEQGLEFLNPEQARILQILNIERKFIGLDIPGFFPITPELARELIALARIQPGHVIMEPEAGLGHFADVITELHPENTLLLCEINWSLVQALRLKGYEVLHDDFLQVTKFGASPDIILMNPPFENQQDIDHVLHAFSLLNTGGCLVAVMAGNKERQDKKTIAFMEFVKANGYWKDNPEGSFISAFNSTNVSTITVVLYK